MYEEKFSQLNLISKVACSLLWWACQATTSFSGPNEFSSVLLRESKLIYENNTISLSYFSFRPREAYIYWKAYHNHETRSDPWISESMLNETNPNSLRKRSRLVSSRLISSHHHWDGSIIHTNLESRRRASKQASERADKQTNGRTNKQISSRILSRSRSWSLLLLSSVRNVCLFVLQPRISWLQWRHICLFAI